MRPARTARILWLMCGHVVDHRGEVALVEDEDRGLGVRRDGGRPGSVVEQRQLADDRARAEDGDLLAVAADGGGAVDDDEGLPPGLALIGQRVARRDAHLVGRLGDLAADPDRCNPRRATRCGGARGTASWPAWGGTLPVLSRGDAHARRRLPGTSWFRGGRPSHWRNMRETSAPYGRRRGRDGRALAPRGRPPAAPRRRGEGAAARRRRRLGPTTGHDLLEDWVWSSADQSETRARMETLALRASSSRSEPPTLDDDGVLRHHAPVGVVAAGGGSARPGAHRSPRRGREPGRPDPGGLARRRPRAATPSTSTSCACGGGWPRSSLAIRTVRSRGLPARSGRARAGPGRWPRRRPGRQRSTDPEPQQGERRRCCTS